MKVISLCMVIVCWLGFANAWADEKASDNVLNKSITLFGGIQSYQADGQFGYAKEGSRNVKLDMKDLGLDETAVSPILGGLLILEGDGPCVLITLGTTTKERERQIINSTLLVIPIPSVLVLTAVLT